jgi:hypothetical protein
MTNLLEVCPATNGPMQSLHNIELAGPCGRLEALVNEGMPDARFAALICHPHPLGGGTMHNKVVYHAMKVLNAPQFELGWPVLRFNFRGTGLSHGEHDGQAEAADVQTAVDWLENAYKLPIVVVGFSFGAAMAISACCGAKAHGDVRALAALGLPTHAEGRDYRYPSLANCALPKLFLSGDRDQYAPLSELTQVTADASEPKQTVLIPGADHFFTGQLGPMQSALASWLKEQA